MRKEDSLVERATMPAGHDPSKQKLGWACALERTRLGIGLLITHCVSRYARVTNMYVLYVSTYTLYRRVHKIRREKRK